MMVPSGMMESLMTTMMPSFITKPSLSRLLSLTPPLFTSWQLAPMREFLSTMALRTVEFGPEAAPGCQMHRPIYSPVARIAQARIFTFFWSTLQPDFWQADAC